MSYIPAQQPGSWNMTRSICYRNLPRTCLKRNYKLSEQLELLEQYGHKKEKPMLKYFCSQILFENKIPRENFWACHILVFFVSVDTIL